MASEQPYVLGTGDDEFERLGFQHRLWGDAAAAAFRRGGVVPGLRTLDVGSGPGHATFDLAALVTRTGRVVAVDESAPFLTHLAGEAARRGLSQVATRCGDVQDLANVLAGEAPFDFAYARWVLCFVPDPAAVVRGVAAALRPGGRFAVHDYFNYRALAMSPPFPAHDRAVAATIASWRSRGGDPDVAGRLPALLDEAGFDVVHLEVHQRIGRGTDSMFAWVDTWWHTYAPKLVAMGLYDRASCDELLAGLAARRGDRRAFVHCPPVYEFVAQKRGAAQPR